MEQGEENKPKEQTLIDEAKAAAERIEAANKRAEELLKQQEELRARDLLGGKSSAGTPPPKPVDKEQLIKERVNKLLEGTGKRI